MKPRVRDIKVSEKHIHDALSGYLQALSVINDNEEVTNVSALWTETDKKTKSFKVIVETMK